MMVPFSEKSYCHIYCSNFFQVLKDGLFSTVGETPKVESNEEGGQRKYGEKNYLKKKSPPNCDSSI